ncbi:MAG: DUF3343 domain-containing protein [Desulfuromonadaceae bacterium]|jgi:hypothetical protein
MKMVEAHHRLLVFNSVHRVMVAEQKLMHEYDILLIPVPAAITADCGMVLRINDVDEDPATRLLVKSGLQPFSVYAPEGGGYVEVRKFS